MNNEILIKLALIRYALLPRQLISFDEAYNMDCYEFNKFYHANRVDAVQSTSKFLERIKNGVSKLNYEDKCAYIIDFVTSLPFIDNSLFSNLKSYNPFDDFGYQEIDCYFLGHHFPKEFNENEDEASIFYAEQPEKYYKWYNSINCKSLVSLLSLYIDLLEGLVIDHH